MKHCGAAIVKTPKESGAEIFIWSLKNDEHLPSPSLWLAALVRPMRTPRQILGGFLRRSIMTGAASDERTALDPILAAPLAAHA